MIATCTHCQARYQLEADKVPQRVIQVRCPACAGVFSLDGTLRDEPLADVDGSQDFETSSTPEPLTSGTGGLSSEPDTVEVTGSSFAEPDTVSFADPEEPATPKDFEEPVAAPETIVDRDPLEASAEATVAEPDPSAVATLNEAPTGSSRRRRCKEEMLARALVSDILVYNREARDTALAEGNLLEVLGGEIKKSWELYKEKVTPEVANSTTYFREALNEILADGQSVF